MISFQCQSCGKVVRVRDGSEGTEVECPYCFDDIFVPDDETGFELGPPPDPDAPPIT
jgi:DNA-directed RNA polymerase subunit RPC12/RpoP